MKVCLVCLTLFFSSSSLLVALDDHRVRVRIDRKVKIVPAGVPVRAMMTLVRHQGGILYLNVQTVPPSLYRSLDRGETWSVMPVELGRSHQVVHGLGVNRKGRLFLIHQTDGEHFPNRRPISGVDRPRLYGQDLFVSYSADNGMTWRRSQTDFTQFGPGTPYISFHEDGNRAVIEQPNGTLLFNTTIVSGAKYKKMYPPTDPAGPPNYEYGGKPEDIFGDVIFRSTDRGLTWGDPSQVCTDLNAHESTLSIGPKDPNRLLIMTRIQRLGRTGENAARMMMETGNPGHYYKQGALFESSNAGRTFRLLEGGLTDWYGHRGTIHWSRSNVVIVTHNWGGHGDTRKVARISLDGGHTWVDGTRTGTSRMNYSTRFLLSTVVGFTSPTIEISPGHFLTAVFHYSHLPGVSEDWKGVVGGIHWHLEKAQEN